MYRILKLIHTPTMDVGSELEYTTLSRAQVRVHVSRGGIYSDSIRTDRFRSPWSKRFCVDYRLFNTVTKKASYPIPRAEDCIDSMEDARVLSTLDCNAGYWQIPMALDNIGKTAFTCQMGTYENLKMAFVLTNAPATFQRSFDIILSGMTWQTCLVYLDDIIVFCDTPENHVKALGEALTRLSRAGVSLKAKKCQLFLTSVEYLGHIIFPGEIRVHNKNLEALANVGTRGRRRHCVASSACAPCTAVSSRASHGSQLP